MRTVPGSGAVIEPVFDQNYGISSFNITNGGSGYASTDPPKIIIQNTAPPLVAGSFFPIIADGEIKSIKVLSPGQGYYYGTVDIGTQSSVVEVKRNLPGNSIVGIQSFKLKSNGIPLFYREFDASNGITTSVDLENNKFIISNHNFQTGQRIIYDNNGLSQVGIATTSTVEDDVDIIMTVGGAGGGSIYENGYNVYINGVTGFSTVIVGAESRYYGFVDKIPGYSITGVGTGAKFEVFIVYDPSSGSAISTSVILKEGGYGYAVGNQVGISGTYLGGDNPTHNLQFTVSKVSSSVLVGQAGVTYTNVPSTTVSGPGNSATFTVKRDATGAISVVNVVNGGAGYALTSSLKVNGSNVGGSNGVDDLFISPTLLGTNVLPNILYVDKVDDNSFRVLGTPNSPRLELESLGVGTHSFSLEGSNESSLITIDNVIQSPIYLRNINVKLSQSIGIGSTNIYLSVGISSISGLDFLYIDSEYLSIKSIGIGSTNVVEVSRGYFGSVAAAHTVGAAVTVVRGDYNIVKDNIYFSTPPYGKIGPDRDLEISSNFVGKAFSRSFDYATNPTDKNIILDDLSIEFTGVAQNIGIKTGTLNSLNKSLISGINTTAISVGDVLNLQFDQNLLIKENTVVQSIGIGSITINPNHNVITGIATTTFSVTRLNFLLKSDKQNVVGLFTDTNSSGSDINNNPFILINNIFQVPNKDYIIDTTENNTIKFISGVPNAGRVSKIAISTSSGYQPLVQGSATATVSGLGTISSITLTNFGGGYRVAPIVSIASTIGSGASITASIGAGGTITSLSIINPGTGYTTYNDNYKESRLTQSVSSGSTIFYIENTENVSIGASVSVGTAITFARIVSVASTFIQIASSNTVPYGIGISERVHFSTLEYPKVIIPKPPQYSKIPLVYATGNSGSGQNATADVIISNDTSILSLSVNDKGYGYKNGDILTVSGITTIPNNSSYNPIEIIVTEEITDKFNGFYPGQLIQLDDISEFFNGKRRRFTLSRTISGVKTPLSLKVDPGVSLKLQNNLFVFLNDILQEPVESFTFSGSKISFTEAPKENSTCTIMYYRGSSLDVEEIIPPQTIKEGDTVQIVENPDDSYDMTQFERIVKKVIATDQFDTLTYDSIGINTDSFKARPLTWKKQLDDAIINGVFYSKSRDLIKSRNIPLTKLIKNVELSDTEIYVTNAFPLFMLDQGLGLTEDERNVTIVDNRPISEARFSSIVSAASSIQSIEILDGGDGYINSNSPDISISSSYIKRKDPIYAWTPTSGISTNIYTFNSVIYSDRFVAVGSSSRYALSTEGNNWTIYGTSLQYSFNDIASILTNNYVGVGNSGLIAKSVGIGTTLSSWTTFGLARFTQQAGLPDIISSSYDGEFKKVVYSNTRSNTILVVGSSSAARGGRSPIFVGVGIGTTQFIEEAAFNTTPLNSVTSNDTYEVTVGNNGTILWRTKSQTWVVVSGFNKPSGLPTLNDVIWDGFKFIAVTNNGRIVTATTPNIWVEVQNNLNTNITKLKYLDGIYIAISSSGVLYYSLDLSYWSVRSTSQGYQVKDITFAEDINNQTRFVLVGSGTTIMYSDPVFNRATATCSVSNSKITTVNITNGGFGYATPPPVIAKTDDYKKETLKSIKVDGDFGTIINVSSGTSSLTFTLKSEYYDNANLGIGYSSLNEFGVLNPQLKVGDRFVIFDSNVISATSLVGITTFNGITEVVGTATTYLDGVYSVEQITSPDNVTGIVTVTCKFSTNPSINKGSSSFHGRYTWGKIYGYQNRSRSIPRQFTAYTNNGLIGLSTSPDVYRTRPLI